MNNLSLVLLVALFAHDSTPIRGSMPEQLSLPAATARVATFVRQQKPKALLGDDFAVIDLTTDGVWNLLKVQILKVNRGAVEQGESFVLSGDKLQRIGNAFGGDGVTSVVAADLIGDQHPLLIYAFAWGSGEHRSEIGILDVNGKEWKPLHLKPVNFSMNDYVVRNAKNGGVEVLKGKTLIGHVSAARKQEVLDATINLLNED